MIQGQPLPKGTRVRPARLRPGRVLPREATHRDGTPRYGAVRKYFVPPSGRETEYGVEFLRGKIVFFVLSELDVVAPPLRGDRDDDRVDG